MLLAIGILLLWLTFRNENLNEIFDKIRHANFFYISLSLIFGFTAFVSRAYRWNMLLEPLGYYPQLTNSCYALGIGYFANLAIPRIGEITRCGTLSKSENIPFEKLIGTVIIERVIDLIMLAFCMLMVAFLEFDLLKNFLWEKIIQPMQNKTNEQGNTNLIIIVIAVIMIAIILFVFTSKKTIKLRERIILLLRGVVDGLKSVFRMHRTGMFIFHTFFIWILYFLATYVCFFALRSTSHLGMNEGMFILVAGGLGMSAPVQGGIGAYHYIVSQGLQLFGISSTDGIVYATLVHTYQTLLVILLGCISLFMVFRLKQDKRK